MTSNKRIEFIDLAKGICIILVVIGHCGVSKNIPGYEIVRMPLYFVLSGLFFKDYGSLLNFIIKKSNKILIPFLFFYFTGYIIFYAVKEYLPSLLLTDAKGIFDIFNNRQFFNGPIWFLLCLYWCNILFCCISLYINKDWLRIGISIIIGGIGYWLGDNKIFIPMFLDVAFTSFPFFVFGFYLKKTKILISNRYDNYNMLFAIILWGISFVMTRTFNYKFHPHYNEIYGLATYAISVFSVLSILFLCKAIKKYL